MHVKIIMCPCYKDYFKAEGHPYLKHLIHFHSKCDQDHEIFVHFCEMHPFSTTLTPVTVTRKKCFCDIEDANTLCQYCCSVRHSLNFPCHKICVEDSEYFREFLKRHKAIPLNDYLEKLPFKPFPNLFYFSKPWYARDLMDYFEYVSYQEMASQPEEYFGKKQVINFDIIHHESRGDKLEGLYNDYQTVNKKDLEKYPAPDKKRQPLAWFIIQHVMICI